MTDILKRLKYPTHIHTVLGSGGSGGHYGGGSAGGHLGNGGVSGESTIHYDYLQIGMDLADAAHEIRKLRRLLKAQVY